MVDTQRRRVNETGDSTSTARARSSDDFDGTLQPRRTHSAWVGWVSMLGCVFPVVTLFGILRLLAGASRAHRLLRRAWTAGDVWQTELRQIVGGKRKPPRLLIAHDVSRPIAVGVFRPTIVLPSWLTEIESRDGVRAVLAHEWAHIRHWDLWLLALLRCFAPLLCMHPLYWSFRRRLRADQELLADASAASRVGATAYAELLLRLARTRLALCRPRLVYGLSILEESGELRNRIRVLVSGRRFTTMVSGRWRMAIMTTVGLLSISLSVITLSPAAIPETTTDQTGGKLVQGTPKSESLFQHIETARVLNRFKKSHVTGGPGGGKFVAVPDEPSLLVGFDLTTSTFYGGHLTIKSLRPIYRTRTGEILGKWHGVPHGKVFRIKAKDAYTVTGIIAKGGHRVDGFRVIFMRIKDGRVVRIVR